MITVTILTKNSQKSIRDTLDSLSRFPEVIVLDSGSTDDTIKIAEKYPNVTVHSTPFLGFGPQHNYAVKLASHDWILSIDSDEVVSKELTEEILSLSLDPKCIYQLDRHNFFNGKHIKGCGGWHPDPIVRFFNRKSTQFSGDLVHEKVIQGNLQVVPLKHPIYHTPFFEMGDLLHKMQHYSGLFADQNEGQSSSLFQALIHSWWAFIKSYIVKRGFLSGKEGFIISMYNGHTAFYKYLKLSEKAQQLITAKSQEKNT